ncbi:flagellar motor switch protein FliN [Pseudomonas putida]|uniref:flagellar motor switch protein FliN n=1 Tax=Pseudomonas putida TaxID=303 RepID=UPI00384FCB96
MSDPNKPEAHEDYEWASALAEQGAGDDAQDPWATALAEQHEAKPAPADNVIFKPLGTAPGLASPRELEMIMDIPVKLSVELGRTRITIKQLLELAQGSVLALDGLAGEPMDILINSYLVAQGEVVVVDDRYGIRITEIITPSERVQKLNR